MLDEESSMALKEIINREKENRITVLMSHSDVFDEIVVDEICLNDNCSY